MAPGAISKAIGLTPEPLSMVICFSGFVKLSEAMAECARTHSSMPPGELWLSIGGGNCNSAAGASVAWQAYAAVQARGLAAGVSWSYQMPYCMINSADIVETAPLGRRMEDGGGCWRMDGRGEAKGQVMVREGGSYLVG
eukprot:Skav233426  [mRNA]  locus=scaffold2715:20203:24162:+ [translate_table: standard]